MARQIGKRAVLLIGHDPLNLPAQPLGEDVIAAPYALYAYLFPSTALIVHHGGIGTTGQALRAGKPMLVVPYGGDQFDNGARVERLGVGTIIRRQHYRAHQVAEVMQRLMGNKDGQQNALLLGQQVQDEQGVQTACDAIE